MVSPRLALPCAFVLVALQWLPATAHGRGGSKLEAAQALFRKGEYAQAEKSLSALSLPQAKLLLGRLYLETGRYAQAAQRARALAKGRFRVAGQTLLGEALWVRGKLDAAAVAFRSVAGDPGAHRARVLLGRLLQERGRHEQARPYLMALIQTYNEDEMGANKASTTAYVAMAARALGSLHDANDAFREAALSDRSRVETQLEWAALFLDKYDKKHAGESLQEALGHNPHHPLAHTLMARLMLAQSYDFPSANEALDRALAVNPKLVAAHVTRAGMALRNMDIEGADQHLDVALGINPNHLEALSVRAAARFLADDAQGFERAKQAVLARNARFSRMYSIIAEYAEWEHRYPELVEMARAALRLDGEDPLAHATLALNLLRMGDEQEGRAALNAAWSRDRFNVQVFNLLNLYENVIDKDYEAFEARPFTLRMHREERAALEPYLVPMLRTAFDDMKSRYRFTPEGPLRLELYADKEHFSVRTTGLPNVGVQGVCFGKVVTAISPRGGPFNWGQITWHELAHIFHLQLSHNHVPRWFTEGLAEYETIIARPEWRREEDHNLHQALRDGVLPKLSELNAAFTRARSPQQLMTAYYAASQAVVYLVERFGFDKMRPMLVAWGKGKRTPQVFQEVLGVSLASLDQDFLAHLEQRLGHYDRWFRLEKGAYSDLDALKRAVLEHPQDADKLAALAMAHAMRKQFAAAETLGLRALKHAPEHPIAHFALTRVALEKGDSRRAERCLKGILKGGRDGYVLRLMLAEAALARKGDADALAQLEAAVKIDPSQPTALRSMLTIAERREDQALALRALTALADLDQHDPLLHAALMAVLVKEKRWAKAVTYGERSLFLSPESPELHRQLGVAYMHTGRAKQALGELDRALALEHPAPGRVHLARARALRTLGRAKSAQAAAAQALKHDPQLADEVREALGSSPKPKRPSAKPKRPSAKPKR